MMFGAGHRIIKDLWYLLAWKSQHVSQDRQAKNSTVYYEISAIIKMSSKQYVNIKEDLVLQQSRAAS